MHPVVVATRQAAVGLKPGPDGCLPIPPREGQMFIHVSRDQLSRTLQVAETLLTKAEVRGLIVSPSSKRYGSPAGTAIGLGSETYTVEIVEEKEKVELTDEELKRLQREHRRQWPYGYPPEAPQFKQVPTGRLRLSLPPSYRGRQSNWSEGPRGTLEVKVTAVLKEIESRAREDEQRTSERRRQQEDRECVAEARRLEQAKLERLNRDVDDWRRAKDIRNYVSTLRERMVDQTDPDRASLASWCDWAIAHADCLDPTVNLSPVVPSTESSTGFVES